ncbi:MAG TPA: hypothetical protein VFJ00_00055 [Candidatus Limnocylindria bacterium]|nr:hypothetical protein [Candidatus Limnocylindria bacterium]
MERWKPAEMGRAALILIGVSWLAYLFVPFGSYLWLGLGLLGLVLVWATSEWSASRKLLTTLIAVAVTALIVVGTSFPGY